MKIAILGTENSHALAFSRLIKNNEKYSDIEIVGVYSYDKASTDRLISEGLAPYAAKEPNEFLDKVDGLMVTARHGDHHYEYALPFIKRGIPAFIDKPFTVDISKGNELIAEAKKSGAPMCGGSSLKFLDEFKRLADYGKQNKVMGGYITAPINMVNDYGNFYFYAQHLVECLISIFGSGIKTVRAHRPFADKNRLSVIFNYGDFDVLAQYSDCYIYSASVLTNDGCLSAEVKDVEHCYERELDEFVHMVKTGKQERSYEELAFPARLLKSIEDAYLTGEEIAVQW